MTYLLLLLGFAILVAGAELLVRGAVSLAELLRISPLIIGLTVVAFGTSAPELAVSAVSSMNGDSEIALGNVIGSNIVNILLIIGLSAVIVPLSVSAQLVRLDVPILIAASVAVWLAALDGQIERWEGVLLGLSFFIYMGWLIRAGRRERVDKPTTTETESTDEAAHKPLWVVLLVGLVLVAIGLGLLVWGAQLLVDSATTIAKQWGVSDIVIGLTIVAIGTSLPELATSVVAAMRGQRDLAVGNAVGSNLFNLLTVLTVAAIFAPNGVPVARSVMWFDLTFVTLIAILCWPVFLSDWTVSRGEGVVMVALYGAYLGTLLADAMGVAQIEFWKNLLCFGITPLVLLVLAASSYRTRKQPHPHEI